MFKRWAAVVVLGLFLMTPSVAAQSGGSIGVEGEIPSDPPTQAPTIAVPGNNQTVAQSPVTVSGICQSDYLIKVFKNNIFSGSTVCQNGAYSLQVDLFNGQNILIARAYDALDQESPASNQVTVTFNDPLVDASQRRVSLSSNFARRGAFPGQKLTWPVIITDGTGPYAFSIDWGDGSEIELLSLDTPGEFTIEHSYDSPGLYNIIIKAVDANGGTAYLQLVGVANGAISDDGNDGQEIEDVKVIREYIWWPALLVVPFMLLTFWLGSRFALLRLRRKLEK